MLEDGATTAAVVRYMGQQQQKKGDGDIVISKHTAEWLADDRREKGWERYMLRLVMKMDI